MLFCVLFGVVAVALVLAMVSVEWRRRQAHVAECQAMAAPGGAYSYDPPRELSGEQQGSIDFLTFERRSGDDG